MKYKKFEVGSILGIGVYVLYFRIYTSEVIQTLDQFIQERRNISPIDKESEHILSILN
jgi:hypothetical protein